MNTPITDATMKYCFGDDREFIPADFARRLELDRAALLEALQECWKAMDRELKCTYWIAKQKADTALASARANFP